MLERLIYVKKNIIDNFLVFHSFGSGELKQVIYDISVYIPKTGCVFYALRNSAYLLIEIKEDIVCIQQSYLCIQIVNA